MLRPWIPVVKIISPGLHAFLSNLIDGRNAAFGYVVDGFDVLEELTKDDTIISIDVLEGIENLKLNA